MPRKELPQEGLRAHPRSALAGPGTHPGAEVGSLSERIRDYERQLEAISKEHYPEVDLLRRDEGIGLLTALTFVLTLEDPHRFEKSRSVGVYLGLVPEPRSNTYGHPRLGSALLVGYYPDAGHLQHPLQRAGRCAA